MTTPAILVAAAQFINSERLSLFVHAHVHVHVHDVELQGSGVAAQGRADGPRPAFGDRGLQKNTRSFGPLNTFRTNTLQNRPDLCTNPFRSCNKVPKGLYGVQNLGELAVNVATTCHSPIKVSRPRAMTQRARERLFSPLLLPRLPRPASLISQQLNRMHALMTLRSTGTLR